MAAAVLGAVALPVSALAKLVLAVVGGGLVYCVGLFAIAPDLVRGIWTRVKSAVQAAD